MRIVLTTILLCTLAGIGYGGYQWYTTPDDVMVRLTELDTLLRRRFAVMLTWWPILGWGVVAGAIEGTDYRSRHLFRGFQRGLMRASVPVLSLGAGVLVVSIIGLSWYHTALQLMTVGLLTLATFTLAAGRPILR